MAPNKRGSRRERVLSVDGEESFSEEVEETAEGVAYRFSRGVDYSPNGRSYAEGDVDSLADWEPSHIANALTAGLIREEVSHG